MERMKKELVQIKMYLDKEKKKNVNDLINNAYKEMTISWTYRVK